MDSIKVAVVRAKGEHTQPSKVWRYNHHLVGKYQLCDIEKELIQYFPDIQQKNLGLIMKYQDSLLETKIVTESDGDLPVNS